MSRHSRPRSTRAKARTSPSRRTSRSERTLGGGGPHTGFDQHFLTRESTARRLVELAEIQPTDLVYEFGAGEGMITRHLVQQAGRVVAYELDRDLADGLQKIARWIPSLEIVHPGLLSLLDSLVKFVVRIWIELQKLVARSHVERIHLIAVSVQTKLGAVCKNIIPFVEIQGDQVGYAGLVYIRAGTEPNGGAQRRCLWRRIDDGYPRHLLRLQ